MYCQEQWQKLLAGNVSPQDFTYAKQVRLGTYRFAFLLSPSALIADAFSPVQRVLLRLELLSLLVECRRIRERSQSTASESPTSCSRASQDSFRSTRLSILPILSPIRSSFLSFQERLS